MLIYYGLGRLEPTWNRCVCCIGTFDGVHLGHQEVIKTGTQAAHQQGLPSVVVTFDRHPLATLRPEAKPPSIQSLDENLKQLEGLGVDVCVVLSFDQQLAHQTAQEFLESFLVGTLRTSHIVIGSDFAFGAGRTGTGDWLKNHIDTTVVQPFCIENERVSSTVIRSAIQSGDFLLARKLLGRPFALTGVVVKGKQIGRTLGFPTANLALTEDLVIPSDGVYGGHLSVGPGVYGAAISIGTNPTLGANARTIEAYLLDYNGPDFYGRAVKLEFIERVRAMEVFADLDALQEQMAEDVERIRLLVT